MKADGVNRTMESALNKAGITKDNAPRLLSDNGSCYISRELAEFFLIKISLTKIYFTF